MKKLLLDGNSFGDEGFSLICNSLIYSKIEYLDLRNNQLSEKSLKLLKNLALKNKNLRKISFQNNNLKENQFSEWILTFDNLKVILELE